MVVGAIALVALVAPHSLPDRPRDVWAFRSVLDGRPRMLTLALNRDLWVAYDAAHGSLYRAWVGGVDFEGSVYTTEHGPQPRSLGSYYYDGPTDKPVWILDGVRHDPTYRGHRFLDGKCRVRYEIVLKDGRVIRIDETPEFTVPRGTKGALERKFDVRGLRTGETFSLDLGKIPSAKSTGAATLASGTGQGDLQFKGNGSAVLTMPLGATSPIVNRPISRPKPRQEQLLAPGVTYRGYQIAKSIEKLSRLVPNQTPNVSKVVPVIDFRGSDDFQLADHFVAVLTARLVVPEDGLYKFRLLSDDGSRLSLEGKAVVDNDGLHSGEPAEGEVRLSSGSVDLRIDYFENEGDETLRLEWLVPGASEFELVPSTAFQTQSGEVHVTSPGNKALLDALWPERPGDSVPLTGVHPSYDLSTPRPEGFNPKVGGIDFLPDGRLVMCCWEPDGGVYALRGVQSGNPKDVTVQRIGFGLAEPLGISVVNGEVFVLQKQELTKLIDHDADGEADEYLCIANGWTVTANFHEFAFGLVFHEGYFYGNLATAINPGGASTQPQARDRGKTIKIDPRKGTFTFPAHGLRTPNGIGFGAGGRIYITDNQGDWLPASKLLHFQPGAFYGSHSVDPVGTSELIEVPPVVWLPQGEIGNSPSQPAPLNDGPYKGQMIHGDVTHGGVKRVFVEEVDGVLQGCVFRFTQGLEAGINRLCWGPDGALYVGGIGSTGNWGQEGKQRFGLQRLKFNGKRTFDIQAVRARSNGLEIEFTNPLAPGAGLNGTDYAVTQWRYVPTSAYGGPKVDEEPLNVVSATVSKERKRVFVEVEGLKAGHVVYIRTVNDLTDNNGRLLWATEAWYTMNRVPGYEGIADPPDGARNVPNGLSLEEEDDGFRILFDGKTLNGWKGFSAEAPGGWVVIDGVLTFVPGTGHGDIMTKDEFGDFEFRFDWRVAPNGNSGVMYRVDASSASSWESGPEYQILDDAGHPDGKSRLSSAAACYGMYPSPAGIVRPGGVWNQARILVRKGHVEHWLNGKMVVAYDLGSQEWSALRKAGPYANLPQYGTRSRGHIVFQDHGNLVAYRNLRIKAYD